MIERECAHCGKTFRVWPSRVKHGRGLHCSPAGQYAAIKARKKKAIQFECIGCGIEFERAPSWTKRKGGGKYCTRECRDKNWKGDLNPNWQDGSGVYKRGPHWQSIRRAILKRDNNECQRCGTGEDLHVHHKIPFRMFDEPDEANHEDNLISLCPPRHRREDAKYKWAVVGGVVVKMEAGSPEWEAARAKLANDNTKQDIAV